MKIEVNRAAFLDKFQTAAKVAPVRSPKSILQNVKLASHNGKVTLTATDLDSSVAIDMEEFEYEAMTDGAVLLPVQRMTAMLRESPAELIVIQKNVASITVKGEKSRFSLPIQNPDEFPSVASWGDSESGSFEIQAELLKDAIKRTSYACDNESSRFALSGVKFDFSTDGEVSVVATDGRRLVENRLEADTSRFLAAVESPELLQVLVPSNVLGSMLRVLDSGEAARFRLNKSSILMNCGSTTFNARMLEGRFPKWQDVFPKSHNCVACHAAGEFNSIVRQASVMASDESRGLDLTFESTLIGGAVTAKMATAEIGDSEIELPIDYQGEKITVCLDHRYLSDYLKVLPQDELVEFKLIDSEGPVVLNSLKDCYRGVIMPLSRE